MRTVFAVLLLTLAACGQPALVHFTCTTDYRCRGEVNPFDNDTCATTAAAAADQVRPLFLENKDCSVVGQKCVESAGACE